MNENWKQKLSKYNNETIDDELEREMSGYDVSFDKSYLKQSGEKETLVDTRGEKYREKMKNKIVSMSMFVNIEMFKDE